MPIVSMFGHLMRQRCRPRFWLSRMSFLCKTQKQFPQMMWMVELIMTICETDQIMFYHGQNTRKCSEHMQNLHCGHRPLEDEWGPQNVHPTAHMVIGCFYVKGSPLTSAWLVHFEQKLQRNVSLFASTKFTHLHACANVFAFRKRNISIRKVSNRRLTWKTWNGGNGTWSECANLVTLRNPTWFSLQWELLCSTFARTLHMARLTGAFTNVPGGSQTLGWPWWTLPQRPKKSTKGSASSRQFARLWRSFVSTGDGQRISGPLWITRIKGILQLATQCPMHTSQLWERSSIVAS